MAACLAGGPGSIRPRIPDSFEASFRLRHLRLQQQSSAEFSLRGIELTALQEECAEHETGARLIGIVALTRDELRRRCVKRAPVIHAPQ